MKIDVVKIIYSSKLRHWKIALRRLSWNCVDKWPNSVKRRHKKMELVPHRVHVICIKILWWYEIFCEIKLVKWKHTSCTSEIQDAAQWQKN